MSSRAKPDTKSAAASPRKQRGRPPGAKNKPKAGSSEATKQGHNSTLTDEQEKGLTFSHLPRYGKLIEAKKKAASDLLNFGRLVKADLGKYGLLKLKIALDAQGENAAEAEAALKERLEAEVQMARWLGMPLNTQDDLFAPDRRPADEIAEAEGFIAGSDHTTPRKAPEKYGVTGPNAVAWFKGFDRAQQNVFDAMEKKGKPILQNEGATILRSASLGDAAPTSEGEEDSEWEDVPEGEEGDENEPEAA